MKISFWLWIGASGALLAGAGCSSVQADASPPKAKPTPELKRTAGVTSPDQELDEERMRDATRGLSFQAGRITVEDIHPANVRRGEGLRTQAEKDMAIHNAWFVSVGQFRDAILADPTNAKSYLGLATALRMGEGEMDMSEAALNTALQIDPKLSPARYDLGLVKQMDSDYAGAVEEWKKLAQTEPGYKDVFARMAIASYYAQDFPSAWKYLTEADRRHQDVPPQFRGLLKEADPKP